MPAAPPTQTAVALSGGGHRATLWGLGVLLYLAAAGRNAQVSSIASVSGGSLANAAVGQRLDYTTASDTEVRAVVRDVARMIAGRGTVFGWWGTWLYLLAVVAGLAGVALGVAVAAAETPWAIDASRWLQWVVLALAVLLWLELVTARGGVTARAFEHTLLSPPGRSRTLEGLHDGLDHVICATELHAGEHVYFSSRFVCAYRFGLGGPGSLPLRRAVQASAAFPPVFPVAWMRTRRFGFQQPPALAAAEPEGAAAKWLALTDGGVYDNMGDQWAQGLPDREDRYGAPGFQGATELIVANSSAGLAWRGAGPLRLPIWGAIAALLRDKSVLYDNGTSVRRTELVRRFDYAATTGDGLTGALVHIPQSPFRAPDAFADAGKLWEKRAERAQNALALLAGADAPAARDEWKQVARENAKVKTTLVSFPPEVCARLLHHAYVLAMVNLHVILGYPLADELPTRQDFLDLLADEG